MEFILSKSMGLFRGAADGACATLCMGEINIKTLDNLLDPKINSARIRAFFVHPDYARRGIGRQIIEFCEMEAKKNGFSRPELGATLPGVPLYIAIGFLEIDNIVELISDGKKFELVRMIRAI